MFFFFYSRRTFIWIINYNIILNIYYTNYYHCIYIYGIVQNNMTQLLGAKRTAD